LIQVFIALWTTRSLFHERTESDAARFGDVLAVASNHVYCCHIGLAATTGLLAAATVSDGLFVGLSSLWSLWLSGFRYGKLGKVTPVLVTFLALVGLGLR
jgi:hypothetical protein